MGLFEISLTRCSSGADAEEALSVARRILCSVDDETLCEEALEKGKSVAIGRVLSHLETHSQASESEFKSFFRGYSASELLHSLAEVTVPELR